jgi:hypothetical protein
MAPWLYMSRNVTNSEEESSPSMFASAVARSFLHNCNVSSSRKKGVSIMVVSGLLSDAKANCIDESRHKRTTRAYNDDLVVPFPRFGEWFEYLEAWGTDGV